MKIYHTSPGKIEKIHTDGRFGGFLFFADEPYKMAACEVNTYTIEINEDDILDAELIFFEDASAEQEAELANLIEKVKIMFDVDEDTARDLIDETTDVYSLDTELDGHEAAENSWDLQAITATAVKVLGYRGAAVKDEQGTSYMIDMLGRENELVEE